MLMHQNDEKASNENYFQKIYIICLNGESLITTDSRNRRLLGLPLLETFLYLNECNNAIFSAWATPLSKTPLLPEEMRCAPII